MPISEESIISSEGEKPGVPLKKSTLVGIGLVLAGIAVVVSLISAAQSDKQSDAPTPAPKAVQTTGKATDIDFEVADAERRKTAAAAKEQGGATQNPTQAQLPAGVPAPTRITPASTGVLPSTTTAVVNPGARPLGQPQAPGGGSARSVEERASSMIAKSLSFDEDAPSNKTADPVASRLNGTATGIDRLLAASSNVKPASAGVTSGVESLLNQAKSGASHQAGSTSRSFYQELDGGQGQRPTPLKSYESTSRFTLHQGKIIPAVLARAINSDIPGEITAFTTLDVYDSFGQGILLLPKGSMLIGRYANDVKVGQSRLMFAFRRLIMPNGRAFDLPAAPGTDMTGAAGAVGDVNNHFWKMFLSSFFVAAVADKVQQPSNVTVIGGGSGSTSPAGQVLTEISKTILERNRNIPPTITLDQGTRINIEVVRDMEFPGAYGR